LRSHREKGRGVKRPMVCFNPPESCLRKAIFFDDLETESHKNHNWNVGMMDYME